MKEEMKVVIKADATGEEIEKMVLSNLREVNKIKSTKYNRNIVYIPMNNRRKTNEIFTSPKNQKADSKPSNRNFKKYTYTTGKNQGTVMYRTKSFYWNAFKWIVCEYQTEVTGRYKVQLLRKYLQDICEMYGHQKDNLIGDLNQATESVSYTHLTLPTN